MTVSGLPIRTTFRSGLAADTLLAGGVIAYPTEAVWGLGCDPSNPAALARLLMIKGRDPKKGLIIVAANLDQLRPFLEPLTDPQAQTLVSTYPAAISWIVPVSAHVPDLLTGGRDSICVRVSTHPVVKKLCEAFDGPVVSTSANPTGRPPATSLHKVKAYFGGSLDYCLAGQLGGATQPSEIRDLLSDATIRPGAESKMNSKATQQ